MSVVLAAARVTVQIGDTIRVRRPARFVPLTPEQMAAAVDRCRHGGSMLPPDEYDVITITPELVAFALKQRRGSS